jgi:hypothetical protein
MTDISITAANVVAGSNAKTRSGIAGATITAGQVVYLDQSSTGKWLLADADEDTAAERGGQTVGIALNSASDGQPIDVLIEGQITIGATLTAGVAYYLSDTPGGICPLADVTGGDYFVIVGVALSTSVLAINFIYSGVAS